MMNEENPVRMETRRERFVNNLRYIAEGVTLGGPEIGFLILGVAIYIFCEVIENRSKQQG